MAHPNSFLKPKMGENLCNWGKLRDGVIYHQKWKAASFLMSLKGNYKKFLIETTADVHNHFLYYFVVSQICPCLLRLEIHFNTDYGYITWHVIRWTLSCTLIFFSLLLSHFLSFPCFLIFVHCVPITIYSVSWTLHLVLYHP